MRTRAMVIGAVGSVAVLAAGCRLGLLADPSGAVPSAVPSSGTTASATGAPTAGATGGGTAVSGIYTGVSENTRYGSVQIKLVVASGRITDVVAVHLTDQGGRSVQLSNMAAPILRSEVLKSQSAKVANVSGATYTSGAYLSSVQSAIDKSGL